MKGFMGLEMSDMIWVLIVRVGMEWTEVVFRGWLERVIGCRRGETHGLCGFCIGDAM